MLAIGLQIQIHTLEKNAIFKISTVTVKPKRQVSIYHEF